MSKRRARQQRRDPLAQGARPVSTRAGSRAGAGIVSFVALLVVLGGLFVWWSRGRVEVGPIPSPDTSAMESQVAERIEQARRDVARAPRDANAWGMLAMVLHAHALDRDAARGYEQASALDPGAGRWRYLQARALESSDPERALVLATSALQALPSYVPARLFVGELEEKRGRVEAALAAYRAAAAMDDTSAAAELGVGRLLAAGGELAEGLRHVERAAALAPESSAIQAVLARSYRRAGRAEEAQRAADRAAALEPGVAVDDPLLQQVSDQAVSVVGLATRARDAETRGDGPLAESLLRRIVALRPEDPDLRFNLGNHLARRGRGDEAVEELHRVLAIDEGHVPALVNLGIALQDQGELDAARANFERALERKRGHPGALSGLGHVAAREGRFEDAESFFLSALASDPGRPDVSHALAQTYLFMGRPLDAIPRFRAAIAGAPERVHFRVDLAEAYARAGDVASARREAREAQRRGVAIPSGLVELLSRP